MLLKRAGFNVRIHSKNKIQHNKFVIADAKKVETGSFNWTEPAESKNEENCLFTDEVKVVGAFSERFNKHLWIVNTLEKSEHAFAKLEQKEKRERIPASRE